MEIGFEKEFYQIERKMRPEVKKKLWVALGVKNRQNYWKYKVGQVEMRVTQYKAVQKVFAEYGIEY